MGRSPILDAIVLASLSGALATGVGALPAWFLRDLSPRARAALGGLAAGIMLAATFFSLLQPGMALAIAEHGRAGGAGAAAGGLIVGTGFVALLHRYAPHEHFLKGVEGERRVALARTWLFVIAITIHNFPEGLAVGVGAASGETSISMPIAIGIGLQNVPEGLIVAASLVREGYPRGKAIGIAWLTGLVEVVGAALGAGALTLSESLLPIALTFSAGAMLFVISDEVLPESHRGDHASAATWGTMLGFVLMMVLDTAFAS